MKKVHAVLVRWVDSTTAGGWNAAVTVASTAKPTSIVSVGYLLEKTNKRVVLGQSLCEGTQEVCNLLTIPRFAVTAIERL